MPFRTLAFALVVLLTACDAAPARLRDSGPPPPPTDSGPPPPPYDAGPPPPPFDAGPPRAGDRDNDGIPDADEAMYGTNPDVADSDGDGYGDGVEVLAGTDPTDASSRIADDDFYVVLPYEDPAQLRELDFTARLGRGDIFFLVDTTGSMGIAISNVSSSLASTIVPAVNAAIADVVMGVGDFRDFPVSPYGDPGDWPFETRQAMTSDIAAVQAALTRLRAGGGADGPEAEVEGLFRSVAGTCAAGGGGFGGACFRPMSHPIIVVVTDNQAHNGPGGANPYSGVSPTPATYAATVAALNGQNVKIVGCAVDPTPPGFPFPIPSEARAHLESVARDTGSTASSGGLTVYDARGGAVSTAVVDGIADLVGATTQDINSQTRDDTSDAVDATRFIKAVRPLRATRATRFDETTFYGVVSGTTVTFEVRFENDFLPHQPYVQIFQAFIDVLDIASGTVVDTRNVYIVVPAEDGFLI